MNESRYDLVVIGAGFSGLATAIRAADFGKRVLVLEAHMVPGGLNSYYYRRPGATLFNTGLHAFTNNNASDPRWGLGFVCRNLGIDATDLKLRRPTAPTRIVTPRFDVSMNLGTDALFSALSSNFGTSRENCERLLSLVMSRQIDPAIANQPSEQVLRSIFENEDERDILRIPILLYGGYREGDVPFRMFAVIFRSLFVDGFGSPPSIKHVLDLLCDRCKHAGVELRFRQRVRRLICDGARVTAVELLGGQLITSDVVVSTTGWPETMRLLSRPESVSDTPIVSAVEATLELRAPLATSGIDATLVFCSAQNRLDWRMPARTDQFQHFTVSAADLFDFPSGELPHHLRIGGYQDGRIWLSVSEETYAATKEAAQEALIRQLRDLFPQFNLLAVTRIETMTPRTVGRYTSHIGGGIYGCEEKIWDGRIGFDNLFLAGNDRGGVGIVGAMVSGVLTANLNVILRR